MKNLSVKLGVTGLADYQAKMGAAAAATRNVGKQVVETSATSKAAYQQIGRAGVIAGGIIVAGFGAATLAAAKFQSSMRNVATISQATRDDFAGMSRQVLELSRRVPQAATTLADGLYDIASSGFDGAEAMTVLEASAIGATAGMTDTATAARSITGVLNAYGLGAESAADVSDTLFQTVNLGVISFEELAQSTGDFVSTAAALGVPIEDASAALATMTLAGINAAESSTALNRVMSSFIKPSEAMAAAIDELGYSSGTAMIEALGLKGAVEAIDGAAGGSIEKIAGMYGEVRAIKGALALSAAEGANYARVTEGMGEATDGAGAAMKAYEEQSKTFTVQADLAKSSLSAIAIEIGTGLLPAMTSVAEMVAAGADAFGDLPGPVKTAVVALTGLAGVIALTGGAALVAVPKIAAFSTSVAAMNAQGIAGAGALTKLGGAMGTLGRFGAVGAVLGVASVGLDQLSDSLAKAKDLSPGVDELTTSLRLLGRGHDTSALTEMADAVDYLGQSLIEREGWIGGWDSIAEGLTGKNPEIEATISLIADYDEALAGLAETDLDEAQLAWNALSKELILAGTNVDELAEMFPKSGAAMITAQQAVGEASNAAAEDLARMTAEAKGLGIDLDATSDIVEATAEELKEMQGSTDPLIFAMLTAGQVTKEQAEAMQADLERFVDAVGGSFADVTGPMNVYVSSLEEMNERGATAWQTTKDASREAWDATKKAAREAWEATHETMTGFEEDFGAFEDTMGEFEASSTISLGQFVDSMNDTGEEVEKFANGITEAIEAGYDPQLVADLLAAGPEKAGPILETLLADASSANVEMVNDSVVALRNLNSQAVEMARLMHIATTSTTDSMVADLDTAMRIAQVKMASGGKLTMDALTTQLGIGADEVRRIASAFGIELVGGLNPVLAGLGKPMISLGGAVSWSGSKVRANALGDITDGHQPEIATGGPIRVWAEPETQGEAYIPLANDGRRGRALAIWEETGRRIGAFADGGFHTAADVPRPPNPGNGPAIGGTGTAVMNTGYDATVAFVGEAAAAAAAAAAGGASATGLNATLLSRFNAWNTSLGGVLRIVSGFRSRAKQEVLYARYLAGTGNFAARPGSSNHERGLAIDYGPANWARTATARAFGLKAPVSGEPWHVELLARGGILNPHDRDQGGPLLPGYTHNGTGRPEYVIPMDTGGIIGGAIQDTRFRGALQNRGLQEGTRAGYKGEDGEDARAAADAWVALALASDEATATVVLNSGLAASALGDASRRIIDGLEAEKQAMIDTAKAAEEAYQNQVNINNNRFDLGLVTTEDHLANIERRMAREVEFSDQWVSLQKQSQAVLRERDSLEVEMEANRYELGLVSLEQHLELLDRRIEGETVYTDSWMSLVNQREEVLDEVSQREVDRLEQAAQVQQAAATIAADALSYEIEIAQNRYKLGAGTAEAVVAGLLMQLSGLVAFSNEWMRVWQEIVAFTGEAGASLSAAVKGDITRIAEGLSIEVPTFQASFAAASFTAPAEAAEKVKTAAEEAEEAMRKMIQGIKLDDRIVASWGSSIQAITSNVKRQVKDLSGWMDALATARTLGISEAVLAGLNLTDGPQGLSQLQALITGSAAEITALNELVSQRDNLGTRPVEVKPVAIHTTGAQNPPPVVQVFVGGKELRGDVEVWIDGRLRDRQTQASIVGAR